MKEAENITTEKSPKEVQTLVQKLGSEIRSPDWIRNKYYNKLNIGLPETQQLEKKEEIETEGVTLSVFTPKTGEEIRSRYINKLMNMGIMKSEPIKKYQHRTSYLIQSSSSTGTTHSCAPVSSAHSTSSTSPPRSKT
jgi:hypothetical protein